MKEKTVSIIVLCFMIVSLSYSQGSIIIKGQRYQSDTIEYRQMGPGAFYSHFQLKAIPLEIYMMAIDLTDSSNTIETFQADDCVGKTEAMTQAYTRLSTEKRQALGAVNGNFWIVSGQGQPTELLGVPHSGSIRQGEMVTDPNGWNRGRGTTPEENLQEIGFAVIDKDKKVWIDDMGFDGKVTIESGQEYNISEINRIRKIDELVFFNHYVGTTTRSDDNGTEAFVKPIVGQSWKVNQLVECEVVRIIKDKGGNIINVGESVLSGNGKAQQFLNKLSVGQRVKIDMGVYTLKDKLRPAVKEMVTGNALVMKNGQLTPRNYNEAYNSQLYPRTGIGASIDGSKIFLIVIDGKGASKGASTETMCEIMKAAGAWDVTSMDGGGSAQMMLKGQIVNKPADGRERAVANGWMLFSTAPKDEIISKIEFADYRLSLPEQASYKPNILAYNQYGVLLQENLKDFELTCDPALGEVKNKTTFIANGSKKQGIITVTYRGIIVSKEVIITKSEISFRLDSVIIDNRLQYPIEVLAKNSSDIYQVEPSALMWTVDNPAICKVEGGILTGLSNGETIITGTLGSFSDKLKVMVEIPSAATIAADDFSAADSWIIGLPSSWKNITKTSVSPSSFRLGYTYKSARGPSIRFSKPLRLYGLPDAVKLVFNPHAIPMTKVIVAIRPADESNSTSVEYTSVKANEENTILIPKSQISTHPNDLISYPYSLDFIKFMLGGTSVADTNYILDINEFSLVYDNWTVGITNPEVISRLRVYPNPAENGISYVLLENNELNPMSVNVYSQDGQLIRTKAFGIVSGSIQLPVEGLMSGIYLVNIVCGSQMETVKLTIN